MKTYTLNSEITLTENQMKEIVEAYNKPKFEYPIFKKNNMNGHIVKFSDIKHGVVVWKDSYAYHNVGYEYEYWAPHTDTKVWEDVAHDSNRDLWHGQPIYCWDDSNTHRRAIRFYDAITKCTFSLYGELAGKIYNNYEAIPADRYDDWMLEAYETLEEK